MKKTFTLLAAMVFSLSVFAYYGQSKLSIFGYGNMNIRVMVDGIKYRSTNNQVIISNLSDGNHTIRIFQLKNTRGGNWGNSGNNMNNYQLVYNSNLFIKPQYQVDIVINRFGKVFTDEQPISMGYYDEEDDWGNNNDNWNNNGGGYNNQAMDARLFDQFKQSLKNAMFDDTRLNTAKQVIASNYFSSTQVREIIQQFSFENNRLEVAKYAYKYTIDKGSYFLVNDAFTFSTTREELTRYIQAYK